MGQRQITGDVLKNILAFDHLAYFVNPLDSFAFATVNAAFAKGHAELPTGLPVVVRLAPGMAHALAGGVLNVPANRSILIISDGMGKANVVTRLVGNIVLADADANPDRLQLLLRNVDLTGNVTGSPNWEVRFEDSLVDGTVERTHGTQGCLLSFLRCQGDPRVDDVSGTSKSVTFRDCDLTYLLMGEVILSLIASGNVSFYNSTLQIFTMGGAVNALVDWNGAASGQIYYHNTNIVAVKSDPSDPLSLYANEAGTTQAYYYHLNIYVEYDSDLDLSSGTLQEYGAPVVNCDATAAREPISNPCLGTVWVDPVFNEVCCWDGGEWDTGGGRKRKELLVDIGVAAADHDIGWDPPADSQVIRTAVKLVKELTGAGGAVKAGFGTKAAGDPDKYGLTPALTANSKDQALNPTWADGGGDDLGITGCDAAGGALGTLAGSDNGDVRVVVWYMPTVAIP